VLDTALSWYSLGTEPRHDRWTQTTTFELFSHQESAFAGKFQISVVAALIVGKAKEQYVLPSDLRLVMKPTARSRCRSIFRYVCVLQKIIY